MRNTYELQPSVAANDQLLISHDHTLSTYNITTGCIALDTDDRAYIHAWTGDVFAIASC